MIMNMIVAICNNNGIGKDNKLVWNISKDIKYFVSVTQNSVVIMGRHTYESIPANYRPLRNRHNIVLTHSNMVSDHDCLEFCNMEELPVLLKKLENKYKVCFIIGGQSLYKYFIDKVEKLYVTRIKRNYECDAFFPIFEDRFVLNESSIDFWSDDECCSYCFEKYERKVLISSV